MNDRLNSLNQRKQDVRRELSDLAEAKQSSENTALGELENALLVELDHLQDQIDKLNQYLSRRQPEPEN